MEKPSEEKGAKTGKRIKKYFVCRIDRLLTETRRERKKRRLDIEKKMRQQKTEIDVW